MRPSGLWHKEGNMNNIINRVWNRGTMVNIEDLRGSLYQNEQLGHTFVISGVDGDGNVVSLSGTVDGAFLRPDNTTVAISGSASGGKAYVTLPANCYDVPGKCGLTIYLTADSQKTALYAAVVTVTRTSSDTASPGTTASVVDLVNAINAAISQIPATDTALKAAMAPTYSNTGLYAVGSYAWYNGVLKRCIVPITTAESYTAAHWTDAALGNDLRDLKSAITQSAWIADRAYLTHSGLGYCSPLFVRAGDDILVKTEDGSDFVAYRIYFRSYGNAEQVAYLGLSGNGAMREFTMPSGKADSYFVYVDGTAQNIEVYNKTTFFRNLKALCGINGANYQAEIHDLLFMNAVPFTIKKTDTVTVATKSGDNFTAAKMFVVGENGRDITYYTLTGYGNSRTFTYNSDTVCRFIFLAEGTAQDIIVTNHSSEYNKNDELQTLTAWENEKEGLFTESNDIKGLHIWNLGTSNTDGTVSTSDKRIYSSLRKAEENLLVNLGDTSTYQFAIQVYNNSTYTSGYSTGWIQERRIIPKGYWYRINVRYSTETVTITDPVDNNLFKTISIIPYDVTNKSPFLSSIIDSGKKLDGILVTTRNKWLSDFIQYGYDSRGIFSPSNSWASTDLFPVDASTTYIASGSTGALAGIKAAEYDANRFYLRDLTTSGGVFTTSADCAYVRLSSNDSTIKGAANKQLEAGTSPTHYVPPYIVKSIALEKGYNLPSYYDTELATTKSSIIEKLMIAGKNKSAFSFITDTHWGRNQKRSPEIIRYIVDHTPIQNVICGGDIVTDDEAKATAINDLLDFQNAFKFLGDRFYSCIGNHEHNNNSGNNTSNALTDNAVYALAFEQSESPYIVCGDYYFYYFDNQAEKTRYLFADTGWYRKWNNARISFTVNALNELDADWHCVVITHSIFNSYTDTEPSGFIADFLDMLDAFNAKTTGTIPSASSEEGDIAYDFTNAKASCKLVVGGHTHKDQTYVTNGGILCLILDCDAQNTVSGNPNTTGTVNEQCVTTIIADYGNDKVYCVRTGRGTSATYPDDLPD